MQICWIINDRKYSKWDGNNLHQVYCLTMHYLFYTAILSNMLWYYIVPSNDGQEWMIECNIIRYIWSSSCSPPPSPPACFPSSPSISSILWYYIAFDGGLSYNNGMEISAISLVQSFTIRMVKLEYIVYIYIVVYMCCVVYKCEKYACGYVYKHIYHWSLFITLYKQLKEGSLNRKDNKYTTTIITTIITIITTLSSVVGYKHDRKQGQWHEQQR